MNYKYGYTHSGIFHADEVFSVAFLRTINPDIQITRGFNPPAEDPEVLVFDIGGGEFDHHTLPREERENDIPYAAFGKLWKRFAPDFYGDIVTSKLDVKLVQEIDAVDNGVEGAQSNISRFIHELNPLWNEDCTNEDQFWIAVDYASVILKREIQSIQAIVEAEAEVRKAADTRENKGILVLEKYVPWISYVISEYPEVMYAIFPSVRGGWSMQVVPLSTETKVPRKDVLDSWKGFRAGNGEAPIEGMTFCHPTGFLSSFETKEQAISAAKFLL